MAERCAAEKLATDFKWTELLRERYEHERDASFEQFGVGKRDRKKVQAFQSTGTEDSKALTKAEKAQIKQLQLQQAAHERACDDAANDQHEDEDVPGVARTNGHANNGTAAGSAERALQRVANRATRDAASKLCRWRIRRLVFV